MTKLKFFGLVLIMALVMSLALLTGVYSTSALAASFSDNFNDGNAVGWTTYDGSWAVESGEYSVSSGTGFKSVANGTSFANFSYEADIKVTDTTATSNAGIIFRVTSPSVGMDNFFGYFAGINSVDSKIELCKMNNGWTPITSYTMSFSLNTTYHMKVVANGSNIKIYVTDMNTPKIDITDTTYASGAIGVRTFSTHAHFDNISVVDISAFSDDFNDSNDTGWTRYGGTWAVESGENSLNSSTFDKSVSSVTALNDFVLEGDVKIVDKDQASLLFCVANPVTGQDSFQGYSAGIETNNTIWIGKHNNNWTELGRANAAITLNQAYRIKVIRNGSNIKVFLNGELKLDVNDSTYTSCSKIGVRGGSGNHVHFDNVSINPVTKFVDDFNDGNDTGWTKYDGTWTVTSGQYNVNSGAGFKAVANGTSFTNFIYEADVSIGATGNAGIIFRVNNPTVGGDNFFGYFAGIDSGTDRVQVGKMSNNWKELSSVPYTINANTFYHLKVEVKGKLIDVYVDGNHVSSVVDTENTHPWAGLVGVRTYNTAAKFDNILVTNTGAYQVPQYDFRWVRGAVFVPTNVVNEVQHWDEYDGAVNDRELHNASVNGLNCVRVYLHYLVWQKDKTKFLNNIEDFLTRANKYGIKTEFVFFDDCWDANPTIGAPYPAPIYGVHNSRWVQCPGNSIKDNYAANKANLKAYVQDVVNAHKNDSRIAFWEPYNEPGNGQGGNYFDVTNQILNDSRIWIRDTGSTIPMTSTDFAGTKGLYVSDFYSWHPYDNTYYYPSNIQRSADILVTECMRRREANAQTIPGVDNAYYHAGTGYIFWEAGIGRDNCRFAWGENRTTPATAEPTIPFHGVIYPDGHPWDINDIKAIRNDDLSTAPVFNVSYFSDNNFATLKKTSVAPRIDFDLGNEKGTGSPDSSAGIGEDNFSTRWTGKVYPTATGTYTFYADCDNIARVYVNNVLVVNKTTSGRSEVSGTISLNANTLYDFKVEYVHGTGNASLHVNWAGPSLTKQIVLGRRY